jgi:uncharacterized membrane protein SirB2
MRDIFLDIHSGWRYIVILATILLFFFFVYAMASKRTTAKQETNALRIWTGVVDVQLLLGIILLIITIIDGGYHGELTGHWIVALIAVTVAHVPAIYQRLNGEPHAQTRRIMGVVLPVIVIVLIAVAISAIDRPFLGS